MADSSTIMRRAPAICGGDTSLDQCPGDFPSDFCCPTTSRCLHISTNSSTVTAAICCPHDSDCTTIQPIQCSQELQNATLIPRSQLHSDPPQQLETCGSRCCPMSYSCVNKMCVANIAPTPSSISSGTTGAKGGSGSNSRDGDPESSALAGHSSGVVSSSDHSFNGASFAAGLVPGLAIGAILAALLVLLCVRKRRRSSVTYVDNEKQRSGDDLTDLSPWRATSHGRSISEPTPTSSAIQRTDFLRSTPPRAPGQNDLPPDAYDAAATGPPTPAHRSPKVKALFSRSPFMGQRPSTPRRTQPSIPAHLKRGTLSFKISPVRALKKQKSTHSLRRQMTEAARRSGNDSTETIQVLMPATEPYTPNQSSSTAKQPRTLSTAKYQPPMSASTWNSISSPATQDLRVPAQPHPTYLDYSSLNRNGSNMLPHQTPTRPPPTRQMNAAQNEDLAFLGSPYTPTNHGNQKRSRGEGGLTADRYGADTRRETTFSTLMERAGLRKSDLLAGERRA